MLERVYKLLEKQPVRYLIVGGFNTALGYGLLTLLTYLLTGLVPRSYLLASAISSFIGITVAFLGYKRFVFRTKGNYWKEWLRCLLVYSTPKGLTLLALPVLVATIEHWTRNPKSAPYIAEAITTAGTIVVSYFGHKHISFKTTGSNTLSRHE